MSSPRQIDHSADGRSSVHPSGDSVVLAEDGKERRLCARGMKVLEATVADDGRTVAVRAGTMDKDANKEILALLAEDGTMRVLDPDAHTRSIDISPDGTQIAYASCFDVRVVDSAGASRQLAHMPVFIDEVEFMPGGGLLARGTSNGWGGQSAPAWYMIDPRNGQWNFVSNLDEAESLGPSVRQPLLEQYDHAYPNSTPAQRRELMEKFGYQLPHFRQISQDKRQMVFDMQPMHQDPAQGDPGVYFYTAGRGLPVPLTDPSLGGRQLDDVEWSSGSRRAAVVFRGPTAADRQMLGVASDDGATFHALPLSVDGRHVHWSDDERLLAFDVLDGQRHIVYVYDAEEKRFFPVLPDASVEGWDGAHLVVTGADGRSATIPAVSIDPSMGGGLVLGSPQGRKTPGEVLVNDDYVEIGGIRVPRRR